MKAIIMTMVALATLLAATAQNADNTIKQKIINTGGMAEIEITPDEIYVQVDLREYEKKGGSKTDIESIRDAFIKAAISVGISDTNIVVKGYKGWDGSAWWYKKNKKKSPELMAGITYEVKLASTKKMDELVAKLDDDATQNFFITRVSHSKLTDYKKLLKIEAIKAAKEKAVYLSAAIGEKVGQALIINDPTEMGGGYQPMYANTMMRNENREDEAAAPTINFKKIKLQFEVNVTFALL